MTKKFLDSLQNIVTNWLITSGFSVGISDLMSSESHQEIKSIVSQKKKEVAQIIQHVHKGILENNTGKPNSEEFELQVNKYLNQAVNECG